jgi:hypothetical protein
VATVDFTNACTSASHDLTGELICHTLTLTQCGKMGCKFPFGNRVDVQFVPAIGGA